MRISAAVNDLEVLKKIIGTAGSLCPKGTPAGRALKMALSLYEKGIGIAIKGIMKIDEELYNRYAEGGTAAFLMKRSFYRGSETRQRPNATELVTSLRRSSQLAEARANAASEDDEDEDEDDDDYFDLLIK